MGLGGTIARIEPGSPAAEVGLAAGDRVVEVNKRPVRDLIDYIYETSDPDLELRVIRPGGEEWVVEIERDPGQPLGIEFADPLFDGLLRCRNRCRFCFLDQMPRGLRPSLYLRDDDYRLSFLHGNFITLTNLGPADLERIIRMRLSPLYVSVHATDPAVRAELMGAGKAPPVMDQLGRLAAAGLRLHTQVVLCPGYNDGAVLDRTIADLAGLWPNVASVGVVPVGLTAHREGLSPIAPVTPERAAAVIDQIAAARRRLGARGIRDFVFLADEFYILADLEIPPAAEYGDFPQLENGIGLIRRFVDGFEGSREHWPDRVDPRRVTVATGASACGVIDRAARDLEAAVDGLQVRVVTVPNRFFGRSVTVAGLLTGRDILDVLIDAGREGSSGEVLIPAAAVRAEDGRFIDDLTVADLAEELGRPVRTVEAQGAAFARAAIGEEAWK